jgi:Dolichyl-phosphate-mannose-protein mannosyltransferase
VLLGLVLGAAGLRVWGLDYGLPNLLARPDEERVVGPALEMSLGRARDPGSFPYPHLVYYADSFALSACRRVGELIGAYADDGDFVLGLKLSHPGLQYRICRAVDALFGTATVLAAFAAAFHGYRRRDVALVAALLVAVNHLHVRDSHYATVDVPMTFFVTMALAFALRAAGTRTRRDILLSALCAGLAMSAKYNGGIVALSPAIVVGRQLWSTRDGDRWRKGITTLALAALVMAAAFAVTSPRVVASWPDAVDGLMRTRRMLFGGEGPRAWRIHLGTTLPGAFGWPGFIVVILGVSRAAWKRRPADLAILAFVIPAFSSIAEITWVLPRYCISLVPPLAILSAEAAFSLLPARRPALVGGLVSALAMPPLVSAVSYDLLASREDTRVQAASWIESNLPPRSRIAVCRGYGAPAVNDDHRRPPAFKPMEVACTVPAIQATGAPYVVTQTHPQVRFFLPTDAALRWLEAGATPIAVFDPFRREARTKPTFYAGDAFYLPYAGFSAMERGGPILTVWRLNGRP